MDISLHRLVFLASFLTTLLGYAVFGQTPASMDALLPGQNVESEISSGEIHRYRISLGPGEFFLARLEQMPAGFSLQFSDSSGDRLLTSKGGAFTRASSPEVLLLSYISTVSRDYFLDVAAPKTRSLKIRFKLTREASRMATEAEINKEADVTRKQGWEFFKSNDLKKAIVRYQTALLLYESNRDDDDTFVGKIICLRYIGAGYLESGEYKTAITFFEKSLEMLDKWQTRFSNSNVKLPRTILLHDLGKTHIEAGQENKALYYLDQVDFDDRNVWKKNVGLLRDVSDTLNVVVQELSDIEDYSKLISIQKKLIEVADRYKFFDQKMYLLRNLGSNYMESGIFDEASNAYRQAQILNKRYKDEEIKRNLTIGMGTIYLRSHNYVKAKELYLLSLKGSLAGKNEIDILLDKANLGCAYVGLRQYSLAKPYLEEALPRVKNLFSYENKKKYIGFDIWVASFFAETSVYLGVLYRNSNELQRSIEIFKEGAEIAKKYNSYKFQAMALNNLGLSYLILNDVDSAANAFRESLSLSRTVSTRDEEIAALDGLMQVSEKLQSRNLAIVYGKEAVNLLQKTRGELEKLGKSVASEFVKENEESYRRLANLLISEERLPEAQIVLDLLKEKEFEQLGRTGEKDGLIPYSDTEEDIIAKIDKLTDLRREESELRNQKKEMGSKFPADKLSRLEQIAEDIRTVNEEFEKALSKLAKLAQSDESVLSKIAEINNERNLQSALVNLKKETNSSTVALYTVIGTEEAGNVEAGSTADKVRTKFGWIILVTAYDRKAYPIDVTNLEETVFQLREALRSVKYDPLPYAKKIYNALFRQTSAKQKITLEQDLQKVLGARPDSTLMWSLDGVFRYIPMGVLHDGNSYLIQRYRNIVFTKQSLLWLMSHPTLKTKTLGLGVSAGNRDLGLAPLPGVEKELLAIVRQPNEKTGILKGMRRLNAQFTKQEILNLKDPDNAFQIVHVASHYSFNPTDQRASYLLTGQGKLTFDNIKSENTLFGTVDMLTLSACDTGTSANGTESEGFAYLAQSLGAKSVIASLWKVSDAGTPQLMIRFYKLRAQRHDLPKGEAFRQAQLSLLGTGTSNYDSSSSSRAEIVEGGGTQTRMPLFIKDPNRPLSHPHYWASFVLIGNWL